MGSKVINPRRLYRTVAKGTDNDVLTADDAPTAYSMLVSSQSDVKSALIKKLKDDSGWRSPSPFSRTIEDFEEFSGSWTIRAPLSSTQDQVIKYYPSVPSQWESYIQRFDKTKPSIETNMVNQAVIKCKLKIKDQTVNYAVAIAESRQTFGLIKTSIITLLEATKAAKEKKWAKACRILGINPPKKWKHAGKDFANRWLEVQYGWKPLLSDIFGAYEDTRRRFAPGFKPRFSGTATVRVPLDREYSTKSPKGAVANYTQRGFKLVKVRLDYELKNDLLQQASQIGLTNPLLVAWELVPWSFVIDWLFPVGDWISSWDADTGLIFKSGTLTKFVKCNRYGAIEKACKPGTYAEIAETSLYGKFEYVSVVRTVYSSAPISLPYWGNPFSTTHVLNALALLRGAVRLH